jgi:hypothetical protein
MKSAAAQREAVRVHPLQRHRDRTAIEPPVKAQPIGTQPVEHERGVEFRQRSRVDAGLAGLAGASMARSPDSSARHRRLGRDVPFPAKARQDVLALRADQEDAHHAADGACLRSLLRRHPAASGGLRWLRSGETFGGPQRFRRRGVWVVLRRSAQLDLSATDAHRLIARRFLRSVDATATAFCASSATVLELVQLKAFAGAMSSNQPHSPTASISLPFWAPIASRSQL